MATAARERGEGAQHIQRRRRGAIARRGFSAEPKDAVLGFAASAREIETFKVPLTAKHGTLLAKDGTVSNGETLRIKLRRHEDGSVYILTAMIDP